jgi:hypothetical protein
LRILGAVGVADRIWTMRLTVFVCSVTISDFFHCETISRTRVSEASFSSVVGDRIGSSCEADHCIDEDFL